MARDYIRSITDMERYYYGAGNAVGYSYSGSGLLKADAPMLSTTADIPSNLRTQGLEPVEPRVPLSPSYQSDLGSAVDGIHHRTTFLRKGRRCC